MNKINRVCYFNSMRYLFVQLNNKICYIEVYKLRSKAFSIRKVSYDGKFLQNFSHNKLNKIERAVWNIHFDIFK